MDGRGQVQNVAAVPRRADDGRELVRNRGGRGIRGKPVQEEARAVRVGKQR